MIAVTVQRELDPAIERPEPNAPDEIFSVSPSPSMSRLRFTLRDRSHMTPTMHSLSGGSHGTTPDEREQTELLLQLSRVASSLHPELMIGCRALRPGDEFALLPVEATHLANAVATVRRASGSARIVARALLRSLGCLEPLLPRTTGGAPRWPDGFVGSLAHDSDFAVAAVARASRMTSVGIDIEPALPAPAELMDPVATPAERRRLRGDLLSLRLLFCVKEAVYKATNPRDGIFLEHHDVEVDFDTLTARTKSGLVLSVRTMRQPRLVALALSCEAARGPSDTGRVPREI